MTKLFQNLSITTSLAVSIAAIGSAPALAGTLTNPLFGGTAATEYSRYCSNGTSTFTGSNCTDSLETILSGNSTTPGGHIELAKSSEQVGFDFTKNTTLTGTIGGQEIVMSSLTESDWLTDMGNGKTLLSQWLDDVFLSHNVSMTPFMKSAVENAFIANGGRQRFSDPKISYVNQDDTTGEISIGLAGHFNASETLKAALGDTTIQGFKLADFIPSQVQASELVKVIYNNGPAQYLYSFVATQAGTQDSARNGNYQVSLAGNLPVTSVPEPSTMLGLMAISGLVAVQKRKSATKA
ncbi:NF038130 family PEP-CTERM protein [Laspinema sp. D1]|uniref:NF038130 family PEP-CTERM protein n=1 Tax=Laspinema palackyanum TaxID=3231601 RepID=UPI003478503E|nr:NF038130 family PEP-CTERM protein [Laspinema sp. D2b]